MILADTSIVIDYERTPTPALLQIIVDNTAAICGITVAEVFVGVRDAAEEARCLAALNAFQRVLIPDALWEMVGRNQAKLRAGGITVPLTDTVIATLAIALGMELWARIFIFR